MNDKISPGISVMMGPLFRNYKASCGVTTLFSGLRTPLEQLKGIVNPVKRIFFFHDRRERQQGGSIDLFEIAWNMVKCLSEYVMHFKGPFRTSASPQDPSWVCFGILSIGPLTPRHPRFCHGLCRGLINLPWQHTILLPDWLFQKVFWSLTWKVLILH